MRLRCTLATESLLGFYSNLSHNSSADFDFIPNILRNNFLSCTHLCSACLYRFQVSFVVTSSIYKYRLISTIFSRIIFVLFVLHTTFVFVLHTKRLWKEILFFGLSVICNIAVWKYSLITNHNPINHKIFFSIQ